ncbi:hypothetical protein C0992_011170 [Termitomyces sp. T32_za158]|nr:hypothetical protein C0992_011170 [Termitomyces sp. T32_za158]
MSSTVSFLQNNLAIMVMEGLLDQIELMKKQCVSALEQIDCTAKCKLPSPEEPTAMSTSQLAVVATAAHEPKAPSVPVKDILLDQRDEEMDKVPWFKDKLEWLDHFNSLILSSGKKVGPTSQGLAGLTHAPNAPGPLKNYKGCKPPILIDNLELIDFPANILDWIEFAQLLFLKKVMFLALSSQLVVVKLTTDPCTPVKYDGLTATRVVDKGTQQAVPTIEDDSDYGQLQSEEE